MKGEIPQCRRCCCCLPLRYGLLAWGYFKMTADAFMITFISYSLILTVMSIRISGPDDNDFLQRMYEEMAIIVVVLVVFLTDFVVTIIFIVGGHKKNVKLFRVFYFISIAMWIFSLLLSVTYAVLVLQTGMHYRKHSVLGMSFYFLVLVVQTYFLFLLRSEIKKLQNIGQFRFVNNAADADFTMTCEKIVTGEVNDIEDI